MGNYVTFTSHEFERGIISQFRSLMPHPKITSGSPKADAAVLSPALTELIWSTAARVRREFERRVETGLKNDMVGILKLVSDFREEMASAARRPRQFSWWVTSLGVLDPTLSNSSDGASLPTSTGRWRCLGDSKGTVCPEHRGYRGCDQFFAHDRGRGEIGRWCELAGLPVRCVPWGACHGGSGILVGPNSLAVPRRSA